VAADSTTVGQPILWRRGLELDHDDLHSCAEPGRPWRRSPVDDRWPRHIQSNHAQAPLGGAVYLRCLRAPERATVTAIDGRVIREALG